MKTKPTPNTAATLSRNLLTLGTLLAAGHAHAEAPVATPEEKKEEPKKKDSEVHSLGEMVVEAVRTSLYKPEKLQSPKFTAPLVDTPQSLTVVPKEVYNQQAAQSLTDVLRNTPGITFLAGEGGSPTSGDNQFRMRGFDAGNSIFVDGVRDGGQQSRDIFNIEQVEISRGASGADVGRSTAAGYINLATKAPQLREFYRGSTSYYFDETDSDGSFRQTVDVNQTIPELPLPGSAWRLNGLYQEGGVIGRNLAENNRWAIAPSFATGLGTDTRVIFQFQYLEQNNLPDYGLPRAALDDDQVGGGSYTPAAPGVAQNTSYASNYAFEDVTSTTGTVRIEHDFAKDLQFTNQTRYSVNDRFINAVAPTNYTAATQEVTRNFTANDRTNEVLNNLSTLRAEYKTGPLEHLLSAGLELIHENTETAGYVNGTAGPVDIQNPNHSLTVIRPTRSGASTESEINTASVNLFNTTKFNEQWQLTTGTRAEYYDLDYLSIPASTSTADPTHVQTDDLLVDWKAGLVYKPLPNGSLYVSYAHSEQNPGTNLNMSASETGTGADNVNSDPQISVNYEVGTKWEFFDKKLITTLAGFRTEQQNIGVATDAITGDVLQTGEQTVTGVEATVAGSITDHWAVFGGIGYAHSENKNPASTTADNAEIQWTPELSGNLWMTYRFDFGLTLGGGVRYTDGTNRSTSTAAITNITGTDADWVCDALASYEINKHITLRFNVNNVFDEEYIGSVNNNGGRYIPGAPRSYVVSADWQF